MTITEFLLARIEEDEAAAQASDDGPWFAARYYVGSGVDHSDPDAEIARAGSKADAAHIARHDPSRVLAECAAKRAIIKQVSDVVWGGYAVRDVILEHLAGVYVDHPDFQLDWA